MTWRTLGDRAVAPVLSDLLRADPRYARLLRKMGLENLLPAA